MSDTSTYGAQALAKQRPATIMVSEGGDADRSSAHAGSRRFRTAALACAVALTVGVAARLTTTDRQAGNEAVATATPTEPTKTDIATSRTEGVIPTAPANADAPPSEKEAATIDDRLASLASVMADNTAAAPTTPEEALPSTPDGTAGTTAVEKTAEPAIITERTIPSTPDATVETARDHVAPKAADIAPMPPIADTRIAAVDVAIDELSRPMTQVAPATEAARQATAAPTEAPAAPRPATTVATQAEEAKPAQATPAAATQAAQPAERTERRVKGRMVLEPSDGATLYRLNPRTSETPITQAITKYGDANVACESRNAEKSCFVSLITETSGVPLKMRVGAAQRLANPDDADQSPAPLRRSGSGLRYVMLIEGPPGMDASNGYSVISRNAFGILPTTGRCTAEKCVAVADIDPVDMPIVGSADDAGLTVTATTAQRAGTEEMALVWRFPTTGMRAAFVRVLQEMDGLAPEPMAPAQPKQAAKPPAHMPRRH